MQALPQLWKRTIKLLGNLNNLYIQDHDLIKCNTIYSLEKLNSRELYQINLLMKYEKPACRDYHEKKFDGYGFIRKLIYRIPSIAPYETKICIIQYKLMNNVLHLNKKLFPFGIISQSKCPFCELYDEIPEHISL